jgi:toxin YoeB
VGKFVIELTDEAKKHLRAHHKSGDKATLRKIDKILEELSEHPYEGTGKPEPLKYELKGFWSRRINHKDRMIYSVNDNTVTVEVVSAIGHYTDK